MTECDTAVIGAGPYGLSVAAHLHGRGADFRVFGRPLDTWRTAMPQGMYLKSDGFASNLSAPEPGSTLADYLPRARRAVPPDGPAGPPRDVRGLRPGLPAAVRARPRGAHRDLGGPRRSRVPIEPRHGRGAPRQAGRRRRRHHPLRLDAADRRRPLAGAGQPLQRPPRPLRLRGPAGDGDRRRRVGGQPGGRLARAGARSRLVARTPSVHFSSPPGGRRSVLGKLRKPGSGLGPGWRSARAATHPTSSATCRPGGDPRSCGATSARARRGT